jgi:hypothetical protein
LSELLRHQAAEERMNTGTRIVVPFYADLGALGRIVAMDGMIKTPRHELRKGDGARLFDVREDKLSQISIFFFHMQRISR